MELYLSNSIEILIRTMRKGLIMNYVTEREERKFIEIYTDFKFNYLHYLSSLTLVNAYCGLSLICESTSFINLSLSIHLKIILRTLKLNCITKHHWSSSQVILCIKNELV